jgi:hypothetical protein
MGEDLMAAGVPVEETRLRIGYSLIWRVAFLVLAVSMLVASTLLLVQTLVGASQGLFAPSSMLVTSIGMSFYLMPFISIRRQVLGVRPEGLELVALSHGKRSPLCA